MIENEFYEDDLELLLKEKADQFSMYPSRRVWHGIYNNLHPGRRWPSVLISLVLVSSLMLIGYLHTGKNSITRQINNTTGPVTSKPEYAANEQSAASNNTTRLMAATGNTQKIIPAYNHAFDDVITQEGGFYAYTIVKSNLPVHNQSQAATTNNSSATTEPATVVDNNNVLMAETGDIIQSLSAYIKSGKLFSDIASNNRKFKTALSSQSNATPSGSNTSAGTGEGSAANDVNPVPAPALSLPGTESNKVSTNNQKPNESVNKKQATTEKAWIENYALQNKPASKKWKGRLGYQLYVTPAVNYRKLTTKTKYSVTPFAEGDVNNSISQKPGIGIEAGFGLNYAVAKKVQLKGGLQFNYTNYNIDADQTSHPVVTDILLNDPVSGMSYAAARTTTISNAYNSTALKPVTLHNRTYQISLPLGFAYKLSSQNNVDWFAGASVQPSYVFGGRAHIISADLKSYVSEPSSIRSWNVNLGFETYMNFKIGTYNLQVGPQVRYQINSTYRRNVALVEKPYAIGLKFGLYKGF